MANAFAAEQFNPQEFSTLTRFLMALPIVGRMVKRLNAPGSDAPLYFLLNLLLLWVLAGMIWGIVGVFAVALFLAPIMLTTIVLLTTG